MSEEFSPRNFVVGRIQQLTGSLPGRLTPWARGMLAQLRQAAGAEAGTVPAIWSITAEGLPEGDSARQRRAETAVHVALTQFAIHQQARAERMHDPERSFGAAVRRLADQSGENPYETPVYRRFSAMATATSHNGLLAHSRGLITQLRGAGIGFDYGRYAEDLYWFQVPGRAASVRRGWGREFHRLQTESAESSTNPSEPTDIEGESE